MYDFAYQPHLVLEGLETCTPHAYTILSYRYMYVPDWPDY